MSVWEDFEKNLPQEEEGFYMKFVEGQERILKFIDVERREQKENTPENMKSPDGTEILLKFEQDGVAKGYTCKGTSNKFYRAMKSAGVELNDTFKVVRTGAGAVDTKYAITKINESGQEILPEEAPF